LSAEGGAEEVSPEKGFFKFWEVAYHNGEQEATHLLRQQILVVRSMCLDQLHKVGRGDAEAVSDGDNEAGKDLRARAVHLVRWLLAQIATTGAIKGMINTNFLNLAGFFGLIWRIIARTNRSKEGMKATTGLLSSSVRHGELAAE